jgi:hypothetical protein
VVAAAEEFAVSAAGGGIAGAMAADVIKASQNAVIAAGDEERLSDEVEGKVIAGARGLVNMTDELPGGGEEFGLFLLQGCWAEIKGCGQSGSASNVAIGIQLKIRHGRSGEAHSTAETPRTRRKSEERQDLEIQGTATSKGEIKTLNF